MPAVMRLTDSELILGTMTPMSLVEPVRSARSLAGPHVSGQLNRLLNALGLVRRYVATVEVARDGGARNAVASLAVFILSFLPRVPCH